MAGSFAARVRAQTLALTHFSCRYSHPTEHDKVVFDASEHRQLAFDALPPAPPTATPTLHSTLDDTSTRSAALPDAATRASARKQAHEGKAAPDLGLEALSAAIHASRRCPPAATHLAGAHEECEDEHAAARREDGRQLHLAVACAEDFMTLCGEGFRRIERGRVKGSARDVGAAREAAHDVGTARDGSADCRHLQDVKS